MVESLIERLHEPEYGLRYVVLFLLTHLRMFIHVYDDRDHIMFMMISSHAASLELRSYSNLCFISKVTKHKAYCDLLDGRCASIPFINRKQTRLIISWDLRIGIVS